MICDLCVVFDCFDVEGNFKLCFMCIIFGLVVVVVFFVFVGMVGVFLFGCMMGMMEEFELCMVFVVDFENLIGEEVFDGVFEEVVMVGFESVVFVNIFLC